MSVPQHAAILLAAGGSRRLGAPKQLVVFAGEPLVRRAARAALATAPAQALIVLGARADDVWHAVADLPLTRVKCADWSEGLSASVRAGLGAVDDDLAAALFVLCDQPALEPVHLCALVEHWRSAPGRAAASSYAGTLGVPAILPRSWFGDLARLGGDRGARDLLRARAAEIHGLPAAQLAADVDVPGDLAKIDAVHGGEDT